MCIVLVYGVWTRTEALDHSRRRFGAGRSDRDNCLMRDFRHRPLYYSKTLGNIPVWAMYSGSWNGFFSTPRFPCKNLRLWHQCLGTGTVFR